MAVPAVPVTTGARRVLRRKDVLQLAVSNHTGTGSGSVLPQRHRFRFGLPTPEKENTEKPWGNNQERWWWYGDVIKSRTSSDIYKSING